MFEILKNIIDRILAVILLIVLFPLFIFIGIFSFYHTNQFPIFLQERGLSLEKYRFKIFKFRTLKADPELKLGKKELKHIFLKNELNSQIHGVLKFIRKTGLDELPQLINIILGQMSFIGPRPLMIDELELLKNEKAEWYSFRNAIKCKPGITGLWQVIGNRDEGAENLVGLDVLYDSLRSPRLEIKIFLTTLLIILGAKKSDALVFSPSVRKKLPLNIFSSGTSFAIDFSTETSKKNKFVYNINLPENWWYASNTYKVDDDEGQKTIRIIKLPNREEDQNTKTG